MIRALEHTFEAPALARVPRAAGAPVEEGVAVLFVVLRVPAALYLVGLSGPLRLGYPALNFALAG